MSAKRAASCIAMWENEVGCKIWQGRSTGYVPALGSVPAGARASSALQGDVCVNSRMRFLALVLEKGLELWV